MKVREFLLKETTKVSIPLATFVLVAIALVTFGFTFSKIVTETNLRLDAMEQRQTKSEEKINKFNVVQGENQVQFAKINTNLEFIKFIVLGGDIDDWKE